MNVSVFLVHMVHEACLMSVSLVAEGALKFFQGNFSEIYISVDSCVGFVSFVRLYMFLDILKLRVKNNKNRF